MFSLLPDDFKTIIFYVTKKHCYLQNLLTTQQA